MITLTLSGGGTKDYDHAVTEANRREFDKRMYRSPFGSTWRTEGSGDALPERVAATIEVFGSDPQPNIVTFNGSTVTFNGSDVTFGTTSESDPDQVISDAENATNVETPYWTADVEGLTTAVVTPVANGYRVRVEWLTKEGR